MKHWQALVMLLACADDGADEQGVPEAGVAIDASAQDGSMDARREQAGDPPPCLIERRTFALGESAARSFSAQLDGERLHIAMIAPSCAGSARDGQGRGVRYLSFTLAGDAGDGLDVDSDDCLPLREPTLLLHGDQQLALYFGSDRAGSFDLYETAPRLPMRTWTERTHDEALELELAAAALGPMSMPALAYVPQASVSSREPAPIRVNEREVLPASAGQHPRALALLRRADGLAQGGGLLAWVSDRDEQLGSYLRTLDQTSAGSGEVIKVGAGAGAIALAARTEVVGVFYSDPQLTYRALGSSLGSPTVLEGITASALSASAYRSGFALAYRDATGLQALSLSLDGRVGARASLQPGGDGQSVLLLESQGRLVVLWDERTGDAGSERSLEVATIGCL